MVGLVAAIDGMIAAPGGIVGEGFSPLAGVGSQHIAPPFPDGSGERAGGLPAKP
jgi:hypothetical protein